MIEKRFDAKGNCIRHRSYKPIPKPSIACLACWMMWLRVHLDKEDPKSYNRILREIRQKGLYK